MIDTGDNQGREGMASVNASRAALGMKPLSDTDPYEAEEWEQAKSIFWSVVVFSIFGVVAWIATA